MVVVVWGGGGVQLVASPGPDTAAALAAAPSLEEGKVGKGVICIRHFGAFPEIFFFSWLRAICL